MYDRASVKIFQVPAGALPGLRASPRLGALRRWRRSGRHEAQGVKRAGQPCLAPRRVRAATGKKCGSSCGMRAREEIRAGPAPATLAGACRPRAVAIAPSSMPVTSQISHLAKAAQAGLICARPARRHGACIAICRKRPGGSGALQYPRINVGLTPLPAVPGNVEAGRVHDPETAGARRWHASN